jgi:tetratricopeptide (TPR) repeat protein
MSETGPVEVLTRRVIAMRWIAAVVLLVLTIPARAQELPKPTEAGQKALDVLIRRCIAAGGLEDRRGLLGLGPPRLVVADRAKLAAEVRKDPGALTPALRDALIARGGAVGADQRHTIVILLWAVGEAADDQRTLAFGGLFAAESEKIRKSALSLGLYDEASRRFAGSGELAWQATCDFGAARIYYDQGEYTKALEGYRRALERRREVYGDRHPEVAECYNSIAVVYTDQGEYAKALEGHRRALAIYTLRGQ